tara:strand:- start:12 stop:827 length:816 start_codon:yes stop_codon:yes gene_type:complete
MFLAFVAGEFQRKPQAEREVNVVAAVHSLGDRTLHPLFQMTHVGPSAGVLPEVRRVPPKPFDRVQHARRGVSVRFNAVRYRWSPVQVFDVAEGLHQRPFPMFPRPTALERATGSKLGTAQHSKTTIARVDGSVDAAQVQLEKLFQFEQEELPLLRRTQQKYTAHCNDVQRLFLVVAGIQQHVRVVQTPGIQHGVDAGFDLCPFRVDVPLVEIPKHVAGAIGNDLGVVSTARLHPFPHDAVGGCKKSLPTSFVHTLAVNFLIRPAPHLPQHF